VLAEVSQQRPHATRHTLLRRHSGPTNSRWGQVKLVAGLLICLASSRRVTMDGAAPQPQPQPPDPSCWTSIPITTEVWRGDVSRVRVSADSKTLFTFSSRGKCVTRFSCGMQYTMACMRPSVYKYPYYYIIMDSDNTPFCSRNAGKRGRRFVSQNLEPSLELSFLSGMERQMACSKVCGTNYFVAADDVCLGLRNELLGSASNECNEIYSMRCFGSFFVWKGRKPISLCGGRAYG